MCVSGEDIWHLDCSRLHSRSGEPDIRVCCKAYTDAQYPSSQLTIIVHNVQCQTAPYYQAPASLNWRPPCDLGLVKLFSWPH